MSQESTDSRERAEGLLELGRPAEAERELRTALLDAPEDPDAFGLLARALIELGRHDEALEAARSAVALAPDEAHGHLLVALAAAASGDPETAQRAVREAIRLEPTEASYQVVHAHLLFDQDRYEEAITVAERAQELDPESVEAATILAASYAQLGRHHQAREAAEAALALDPAADHAHAAAGFAAIARGDSREAVARFRVALRLDPTDEAARAGLVESLKARNPVYGALIRFFLWQGRLPSNVQNVLTFSPLLFVFLIRSFGLDNRPAGIPLIAAACLLLLVSWAAEPVMNLVLLATREGAILLVADTRRSALLFLGFSVTAVGAAVAVALGAPSILAIVALGLGFFSLGVGSSHHLTPTRRRFVYVAGVVLAVCSLLAAALSAFVSADALVVPSVAVLLIGVGSLWLVRLA
jgi:tetratricopeptide (TPR) repeat protein